MKIPARAAVLAAVAASAFFAARPARAQGDGEGFLFQPPFGSWSLHGGFAMPRAGSDLFSFTTANLTVNRGDFSALDFGAELAFTVSPRIDLVFDVSHSGMSKGSEFRNFVDNNNLPIEQTTTFDRTPLTVSARYYLVERGRQIGHYAWVPSRVAPYLGAGAGVMFYNFEQKGDFIDNTTLAVFPDQFHSGGSALMGQLLAGADWTLSTRWALRTEARYLLANASPGQDFAGFHRIDLSGVTTSVGFFVRF